MEDSTASFVPAILPSNKEPGTVSVLTRSSSSSCDFHSRLLSERKLPRVESAAQVRKSSVCDFKPRLPSETTLQTSGSVLQARQLTGTGATQADSINYLRDGGQKRFFSPQKRLSANVRVLKSSERGEFGVACIIDNRTARPSSENVVNEKGKSDSDVICRAGINPHYQQEVEMSSEFRREWDDYLLKILRSKVYDVAIESPLEYAPNMSLRLGNRLLLKREDLQQIFSFKLRGAFNKMANLSPEELAKGIVACSAGNHAQGVALAARTLGCDATIVMPETTPEIKVSAVRRLGGKVVLHGDSYDAAAALASKLSVEEGMVFVHPFDDPDTIAGQGTVGMEILRQTSKQLPHAIFVPCGGGGLLAGVAAYVKKVAPSVKVIGVEPVDSCCMHLSLQAGERVKLDSVGLFADGVAVKLCGEHTYSLVKPLVDEIVLVDTDEACAAIKDIFTETRSICEAAGALSVAGAKKYVEMTGISGETLVAITSGGNLNFDVLRYVSERTELGEQREVVMAVTIPERPGAFREFCSLLGPASVTEFNYRYMDKDKAAVFVGVQVRNKKERQALKDRIREAGCDLVDLTENELAKLHVRHLVGGRAVFANDPQEAPELLFRFEFPERPGALMRFLNNMSPAWNISLFHYRNHGADIGRVLVGIQVPQDQREAFSQFLDTLVSMGYQYVDENENPAYTFFLK